MSVSVGLSVCLSVCLCLFLSPPLCLSSYLWHVICNPKHCTDASLFRRNLCEECGVNLWKLDAMDQNGPDVGKRIARALSAISICSSWRHCVVYKGSYMADGSGVYAIPVPWFPPSIHNLQTYVMRHKEGTAWEVPPSVL